MHGVGYIMIGITYLVVAVPLLLLSLFVFTGLIDDPVKIAVPALLIFLVPLAYLSKSGIQIGFTLTIQRAHLAGFGFLGVACILGLIFGIQAVLDIQECADALSSRIAPTKELATFLCR